MREKKVNLSAQTVELSPQHLSEFGNYIFQVAFEGGGARGENTITLVRLDEFKLRAFILQPPNRSISIPPSPLRLYAMVEPPGDCYEEIDSESLAFE